MKGSKARAFILVVLLSLVLPAGSACAQTTTTDTDQLIWPTYHYSSQRTGQNSHSSEIANPASLGLIWVFPRDVSEAADSVAVVDTTSDKFTAQGLWRNGQSSSARNNSFIWRGASDTAANAAKCWWNVPISALGAGKYQIAVWVPAAPEIDKGSGPVQATAASQVVYTVYDDNGPTQINFDQRDFGRWALLSTTNFSFTNSAGDYKVELTTLTKDSAQAIDDNNIIVMADSMKFIPQTGMEIYGSPVSAEMQFQAPDPNNAGAFWWNGLTPFVFVGTVETPLTASSEPADTGAVYCINSITPTNVKKDVWSAPTSPDADKLRFEGLSNYLGTTRWRYPHEKTSDWDELEGPIEGGIFSSPTLAYVDISSEGGRTLVCFVTGMDRQVYALKADDGKLLWKGPGITLSEGTPADWSATPALATDPARSDAFGGKFHWAECSAFGGSETALTTTWEFKAQDRIDSGFADGSFAVYAWIPVHKSGDLDGKSACPDATYKIYYQTTKAGGGSEETFYTATVDQSKPSNQGRWVRLGQSYYSVSKVVLDNFTKAGTTEKPAEQYGVVADAVMIVPSCIAEFGYCSPVTDTDSTDPANPSLASFLYASNSAGRAICFDLAGSRYTPGTTGAGHFGKLSWIYPHVRTSLTISKSSEDDQPPMGDIGASPVFYKVGGSQPSLFIATTEGKIHCLRSIRPGSGATPDPTLAWAFQDPKANTADDENTAGFTSSPAIDDIGLYIGSTGGVFYKIDPLAGTMLWRYPDVNSTNAAPLGGFNYSTPAVALDSDSRHRAWIGSADGHIYSFSEGAGHRLRVDVNDNPMTEGIYYSEPLTYSTLQGSVALDSSDPGHRMLMFVGDMNGMFHWFDAQDGLSDFQYNPKPSDPTSVAKVYKGWRCGGQLFSSPNISHTQASEIRGNAAPKVSWIYQGSSDGRVYAFSHAGGAWGGDWVGGDSPYGANEPVEGQRVEDIAPDTDVQFDLFPGDFYENAMKFNPEPTVSATTGSGSTSTTTTQFVLPPEYSLTGTAGDMWPVGKTMKLVDPTSAADNAALNTKLLDAARTRRTYVFSKSDRTTTGASSTTGIYFEWGETLYLMLWNLPEKKFLSGSDDSSKMQNIRLEFTNASPGEAAGGSMVFSASTKVLKDYTVLDEKTQHDVTVGTGTNTKTYKAYNALKDKDPSSAKDVRRSYLIAKITIDGKSNRPCPGPGWLLTARVRKKDSTDPNSAFTEQTIPVAKLEMKSVGSLGTYPVPKLRAYKTSASTSGSRLGTQSVYDEQPLGINNPIAIADESRVLNPAMGLGLGWGNGHTPNRNDVEAHFNGNAVMTNNGNDYGMSNGRSNVPLIDLDFHDFANGDIGVGHGRTSRQARLGVMDRSAMGICIISAGTPPKTQTLSPFRVSAGDMRFRGGDARITVNGYGRKFPWEQGPGSVDYPNILKRNQSFMQASSDSDPTRTVCELPPLMLKPPYTNPYYPVGAASTSDPELVPDTVFIQVDVPQYQPANMLQTGYEWNSGYAKSMEAFIDNNGNGSWDSGVVVRGRPALGQEPYRRFRVQMGVPPDPKLEVEEQLVDLGSGPHGLGEMIDFNPFNPAPDVQRWFKKLTIKNAGNVNLWNIHVGRNLADGNGNPVGLNLFSDGANMPLPGSEIVSSLDPASILALGGPVATNPLVTVDENSDFLGCTLSKPRVGDPDPSILTIPDKRKWDMDFNGAATATTAILNGAMFPDPADPATKWHYDDSAHPLPVEVGVKIPLTQPIGTYSAAFVPVFSDTFGMDGGIAGDGTWQPGQGEPFANPSFQLKVSVKENQLTGGISPTTLPQVDKLIHVSATGSNAAASFFPPAGDTTPAAFKDHGADGGSVHLVWSSNRLTDPALYPAVGSTPVTADVFASAPWFINSATLGWDGTNNRWQPDNPSSPTQWWKGPAATANPFLPSWQWPAPASKTPADVNVMPWSGSASSQLFQVKHHSPTIGQDQDRIDSTPGADTGLDFLAWIGTASKRLPAKDPTTGSSVYKVSQEHMIFYTDATKGTLSDTPSWDSEASGRMVYSIAHDSDMVKRSPSMSIFNNNMWMFWQGGESGRWSIYYSINDKGADGFPSSSKPGTTTGLDYWSPDMRLRTPDCLASVSSPNALRRLLWKGGSNPTNVFDIVYAGTHKLSQNSDIILGKYAAQPGSGANLSPGRRALPLPRVYDEKLERDPKFGYFTAKHLAWLRLDMGQVAKNPALLDWDNWGDTDTSRMTDYPYVHVFFPAGYKFTDTDGNPAKLESNVEVSATDGSVWEINGANKTPLLTPTSVVKPEVDDATSVYTYKYKDSAGKPTLANALLGDMLADYSSGVVRFTRELRETQHLDSKGKPDGFMDVPEVRADYTPQSWRVTTDRAADTSPRAFIERTVMNDTTNPGLGGGTGPVDRLWVFWRKAGTGIDSSTIFFKTYRMGVDLAKLGKPAVIMDSKGSGKPATGVDLNVTGALGPWEVNSTGKKIYFTGVDERYRSLSRVSGLNVPGPMSIIYKTPGGTTNTVNAGDVSWLEELPEQSLFGFSSDTNINEGGIYAFADTNPGTGTLGPVLSSKIWVFWTSTRGGTSDLFWETLSPNFSGR